MNKNDEILLQVSDAAFEGKCVARVDGFVVFVEDAIPGDEVKALIVKVKKNHAEARAIEIVRPSDMRDTPRCRYFGLCGGCKWQNMKYESQLDFKHQNVVDTFERIGGFRGIQVNPVIGARLARLSGNDGSAERADDIYYYRNKMEFSFGRRWLTKEEMGAAENIHADFALGFHIPQRWEKVLDIQECHLQSVLSVQILNELRSFSLEQNLSIYNTKTDSGYLRFVVIRQARATGQIMINLVTSTDEPPVAQNISGHLVSMFPQITTFVNTINEKKAQIAYGETSRVYHGDGVIMEKLGNLSFMISPNSFFQTNTAQAEKLYAVAKQFAELRPTDVVYDLYSGTGSIALSIAASVSKVIGVENVASAIEDAKNNARLNGITNCEFILGDLKDRLTKDVDWMRNHPKPDVLIIDPPRSGMHPKVVEEIVRLNTPRIVYVSCNPATQARDIKMMVEGGYTIEEVQPVDMFPHTFHVENVVKMKK